MVALINAQALRLPLADECVQCVVTSPPYYGMRDYKDAPGQIGAEETLAEYVANLVAVFAEVWRVLRDDGVLWLNLGDAYCGYKGEKYGVSKESSHLQRNGAIAQAHNRGTPHTVGYNLKPKDLMGVPWRVALALQDWGWWLRADNIWHKTNGLPESPTDRTTRNHEYVFLLSKSQRYYFDPQAIAVPRQAANMERDRRGYGDHHKFLEGAPGQTPHTLSQPRAADPDREVDVTARRRSVWSIPTANYHGGHFAVMPEEIAEIGIKAGTSEAGQCPVCGEPYHRTTETVTATSHKCPKTDALYRAQGGQGEKKSGTVGMSGGGRVDGYSFTTGWRPGCQCGGDPVPQIVLDPFCGSGTTPLVARRLGRVGVGVDLSYTYLREEAWTRLELDKLARHTQGAALPGGGTVADLPLFSEREYSKQTEGGW